MTVFFIGAGPGDPELMTLKGLRILKSCPVVLYAGSLIPREVLQEVEHSAEQIIDTATINLDEMEQYFIKAHQANQDVARLQCGDPSLYGAIGEQIRRLEKLSIDYQIIPGVSAVAASAAYLGKELTLSGVSQTIIFTRYEGKTPFPERERLPQLARAGATLAIHLGVTYIKKIVAELIPHYGEDCPVAVCYRTSWPDQDKVTGTLADISEKVRLKGYKLTALIIVGRVLDTEHFADSHLYSQDKPNIFRKRKGVINDLQQLAEQTQVGSSTTTN